MHEDGRTFGVDEERIEAERGPFRGDFRLDRSQAPKPNPDGSAYRAPVLEADYRAIGALVRFHIGRHDAAMRDYYPRWRENRILRHNDRPASEQSNVYATAASDPQHRQRYHPNIIRPPLEQHLSMVLSHHVHTEFRPASGELEDEWAAQQAQSVMAYQNRLDDIEEIREQCMSYAIDCSGLAFIEHRSDPESGDPLGEVDTPDGAVTVYEGMARREVVPPWEMCWDPGARYGGENGLQHCRWIARRRRASRDELEAFLTPEQLKLVSSSEYDAGFSEDLRGLYDLDDPHGGRLGRQARGLEDPPEGRRGYVYVEFHLRRSREWPRGLFVQAVNGIVIAASTALYAEYAPGRQMDLPYVCFCHSPVDGRLPGVAYTGLAAPMQKAANASNSARLEAELSSAYDLLVITGTGKIRGGLRTEAAQVLCVQNPAANITNIRRPPPRHDDFATTDRGVRHVQDLVGVHDVSLGRAGSADTATEALKLSDADQTGIGRVVRRLNKALQDSDRMLLRIIARDYALPRHLRIAGEHSDVQARAFVGSDIAGYQDVEYTSDSYLPSGPSARAAALSQLADVAAKVDPHTPVMSTRMVRDALGFKASLFGDEERVRRIARSDAMAILEHGQPPEVEQWDNHHVHFEEYQTILNSRTFRRARPEHKALFRLYIDLRFRLAAEQAATLAMGAAPPAATGEPPNNGKSAATPEKQAGVTAFAPQQAA